MLLYGAHLLRNGAALIVEQMLANGWLTHLATNGAGTIHDWEYAWFGASTESVEMNVEKGQFGTWDETATNIHLALAVGLGLDLLLLFLALGAQLAGHLLALGAPRWVGPITPLGGLCFLAGWLCLALYGRNRVDTGAGGGANGGG